MSSEEEQQALRQENQEPRTKLAEALEALSVASVQIAQLTQRVEELEARVAKDSHNSHLPPSSDRFARQKKTTSQRKRSGKKPGGQGGHDGHHLALVAHPDEIVVHRVEVCATCQADVRAVATRTVERRQVVDLPPGRLHITEHQAERTCCPHCAAETRAAFPDAVSAPVPYGTGLQALAVYLVAFHLLPFKRAGESLSDVTGTPLSAGALRQIIARSARALQPIEQQIKIALGQAPVIHQDETGLSVAGERIWMHVTSTNRLTHSQIHAKRGTQALDANGILPGYQGTSVPDGWPAYEGYGSAHALCIVHLLRELILSSRNDRANLGDGDAALVADPSSPDQLGQSQRKTRTGECSASPCAPPVSAGADTGRAGQSSPAPGRTDHQTARAAQAKPCAQSA